jgi:transcriptional regulator with XRE-family HTH domain
MKPTTFSSDLPDDIRSYLEGIQPVTSDMIDELAKANRELQSDPAFEADVIKMVFVNEMLEALEAHGKTKAKLADKLGKSRQYVQKLFNEDKRVNFTIDTMCEIAHALDRRVYFHVCKFDEEPMILTSTLSHEVLPTGQWPKKAPQRLNRRLPEFINKPFFAPEETHSYAGPDAA